MVQGHAVEVRPDVLPALVGRHLRIASRRENPRGHSSPKTPAERDPQSRDRSGSACLHQGNSRARTRARCIVGRGATSPVSANRGNQISTGPSPKFERRVVILMSIVRADLQKPKYGNVTFSWGEKDRRWV